jgi:hypothetical protein
MGEDAVPLFCKGWVKCAVEGFSAAALKTFLAKYPAAYQHRAHLKRTLHDDPVIQENVKKMRTAAEKDVGLVLREVSEPL